MNVLSLFDGISCLQLALKRANIPVEHYYASEIKKHAIALTMHHFPETVQIGDIKKVHYKDGILYYGDNDFVEVGKIDLMAGGSPCQDFSLLNVSYYHEYGLDGTKSGLFYEYLRLLKEVQPTYWLLENVKMRTDSKTALDSYLGVEGVLINSRDFSYQNRPRFYWTNIPILPYEPKNISFQDYKDTDPDYCWQFKLKHTKLTDRMWSDGQGKNNHQSCSNVTHADKVNCLLVKQYRCPNSGLVECEDFCRLLTRHEIEQAQTLPPGYTDILSWNQMQDVCGDGWTVDVIAHILSGISIK